MPHRFICCALVFAGCVSDQRIVPPNETVLVANPRPIESAARQDCVTQLVVPRVDVLWVVDNSSSMADQQADLAQAFPSFMNYFLGSGLDYHIGVVSTDMDAPSHSGRLQSAQGYLWVDDETDDAVAVLGEMTTLGTEGSGQEKGRDPVYAAIEIEGTQSNLGYFREDAAFHAIVISDEEDQSIGIGVSEFVNWIKNLKPEDDQTTFSAIAGLEWACAEKGQQYQDTVAQVGGIFKDICDPNWTEVLERLGLQAAGLKREYFLSQLPVADSLSVWVDDDGIILTFVEDVDYEYNAQRNSITFIDFVPDELSRVCVDYVELATAEEE